MKNRKNIIILAIVAVILIGFGFYYFNKNYRTTPTIKQGLYGIVTEKIGNCMPSTTVNGLANSNNSCDDETPISNGSIDIYQNTNKIMTISSNKNGFFETNLSPGTYTISSQSCVNFCETSSETVTVVNGLTKKNLSIDDRVW